MNWLGRAPKDPSAAAVEFVTKLSADRKGLDAFTARMRAAPPDEQGLLIAAARARFGEDPFAAWEASAFVSELTLDRKGLDGFQARMAASTPEQQALLVSMAKRCFGDQPLEWWRAVAQARGDRTKVTIAAPPPHGGANKAALLAVGALMGNLNAGALAASVASVSVNDKIHVPTVCNICGVYEGTKSVTVSTTATTSELGKALGGPVMGDIKADLNVPICAVCDKFPTHRKQLVPTLSYLKVQGAWAVVLMVANDVVAERYAILNHAEVSGSTSLAFASWKGHQDTITELLAAGTPVDITDKTGSTPLMLAAAGGHRDTTLALLAAGANVNATNNVGNTALILAATKGHLDTVAALLAARADVTARDENGTTALMIAAMNGHREIVAALLSAKPEVNAYNNGGNTALILAALNGHRDTVAALLAARADTTARNKVGRSAADLAAERGHTDVVNQLTGLATLGPLGMSQAPTTANQARQPSPQTTNQAPQVTPAWLATTNPAAGWFPDPCTRHELRYFDGRVWTQHVSDAGQASVDTRPIFAAEETTAGLSQ